MIQTTTVRAQTAIERMQDAYYNMTYELNRLCLEDISHYVQLESTIYYLGQHIKTFSSKIQLSESEQLKQAQKKLTELFRKTIWFTYRKVFPSLVNQVTNQDYISDTGWGCMVRAGQMIFAQGLQRHLQITHYQDEEKFGDIIAAFADDDKCITSKVENGDIFSQTDEVYHPSPYSIQKIADCAKELFHFHQQPGQWYNPNRICIVLEKLHSKQNIKNTDNLIVCTMNTDSPIVFETLLRKMCQKQDVYMNKCKCKQDENQENYQKSQIDQNLPENSKDEFENLKDPIRESTISEFYVIDANKKNQPEELQQSQQQQQNQFQQSVTSNTNNNNSNYYKDIIVLNSQLQQVNNSNGSNNNINISNASNNNNFINNIQNNNNIQTQNSASSFQIIDKISSNVSQPQQQQQIQNTQQSQIQNTENGFKQGGGLDFSIVSTVNESEKNASELRNAGSQFYCKNCHKDDKSLILFIGCKIGLQHPEEKYLQVVNELLSFRLSIGMIGGKPQKAFYFPGRIDNNYIYLDPHKVQQFTSYKNLKEKEQLKTHFCPDFQTIHQTKIDSCLSLGFYIRNLEELQEFYNFMHLIKKKYNKNNFIWIEDTTPSYLKQEETQWEDLNQDQIEDSEEQNQENEQQLQEEGIIELDD